MCRAGSWVTEATCLSWLYKGFCFVLFSNLFLCVWVFWLRVCVPRTCLHPQKPEVSNKSPRTGVRYSWEVPYGCWELSSGPLEEQKELLATEPSLHPLYEVLPLHHSCCSTCVDKSHVKEKRWFLLLSAARFKNKAFQLTPPLWETLPGFSNLYHEAGSAEGSLLSVAL